jgi:hypothetical protein
MFSNRSWTAATVGACWVALAAGCGAKPIPTKGVVLFDDRPLPNATVQFHSQEPGGHDATGYTNAQGAFELTTNRLGDGAFPGSYKITVRYSEEVEVSPDLKSAEDVQKAMVQGGASRQPAIVLPETYTRSDQTPLTHRVPEDGDVKLDLRRAPPQP